MHSRKNRDPRGKWTCGKGSAGDRPKQLGPCTCHANEAMQGGSSRAWLEEMDQQMGRAEEGLLGLCCVGLPSWRLGLTWACL